MLFRVSDFAYHVSRTACDPRTHLVHHRLHLG